jgi:hypothetical protein
MNPFRYSGPVGTTEVIDRTGELKQLLDAADSANNSRLLAPREYGKTSLLRRVLEDAQKDGWATVYVDFFGVLTLADVSKRIESAYREQLPGELGRWFEGIRRRFMRLRVGGGPVPASVDVDLDPQAEDPLLERLATPRQILKSRGLRTLVVFDEFQDVLGTRQDADQVVRSEIQHHGEAASYIFAGSELGMMQRLFGDRRRAFYRQARRVDLPPLPETDLSEYIASRFSATGRELDATALAALLDRVAGHPRCAMLLAHELWARADDGRADLDDYDDAEREALQKAAADLRGMWRGLTRSERGLATALARGEAPFSRKRSDAGSRGSGTQGALDSLVDAGEVVVRGKQYSLVDPFFAELLRRDWLA